MRITKILILEVIKVTFKRLRFLVIIFNFLSVASMILTIITLAKVDLPVIDKVLLSVYVVAVAVN